MILNEFQQKLLQFTLAKRHNNWEEMSKLTDSFVNTLPIELAEKIKAGQQFDVLNNTTNAKASFKVNRDCILINIAPTKDEDFTIKLPMFTKDEIINFLSNDDGIKQLILFEVHYTDKTKGKYSLDTYDGYDLMYKLNYLVKLDKSANILNEKQYIYEVLDQESFYEYHKFMHPNLLHYTGEMSIQYKSVATEVQRKLLGVSIDSLKRGNKKFGVDGSAFSPI